ncbi:MAG: hypothetical protein KDA84_21485, partial [Planctomycetaceae bacterium]|nr:hypothetical protein [Planctomycetaceae bacterium]
GWLHTAWDRLPAAKEKNFHCENARRCIQWNRGILVSTVFGSLFEMFLTRQYRSPFLLWHKDAKPWKIRLQVCD